MLSRAGLFAALAVLAACAPGDRPGERAVCGYRCGPASSCPDGYECYADGRCHLEGTPDVRGCSLDAGGELPPVIESAYPADQQIEVPRDAAIRVVFTKPVTGVSHGSFTLRRLSAFEEVDYTVSYDEDAQAATLVTARPLDMNMRYVVTVGAPIADAVGHELAPQSWEFTTVRDTMPPHIVTWSPADGATGVGVEDPVVVTFSEQMFNFNADSFYVRDSSGNLAGATKYVSGQLIRNGGPWSPNTTYIVTINVGMTDAELSPLVGAPMTRTFTTGPDTVPPRIKAYTPAAGEEGVLRTSDVWVLFSELVVGISPATAILEQLDGTPVAGTLMTSGDARGALSFYIQPSEPLAPDTAYRVRLLPGITDTSGNPVVNGILSWTFRTALER